MKKKGYRKVQKNKTTKFFAFVIFIDFVTWGTPNESVELCIYIWINSLMVCIQDPAEPFRH